MKYSDDKAAELLMQAKWAYCMLDRACTAGAAGWTSDYGVLCDLKRAIDAIEPGWTHPGTGQDIRDMPPK